MLNSYGVRLSLGNLIFSNTRPLSLGLPCHLCNVCVKYAGSKAPRKRSAISVSQTQLHPGCYHLVSLAVTVPVPPHSSGHSQMFFCPLSTALLTHHQWNSHLTCSWAQTSSCGHRSKLLALGRAAQAKEQLSHPPCRSPWSEGHRTWALDKVWERSRWGGEHRHECLSLLQCRYKANLLFQGCILNFAFNSGWECWIGSGLRCPSALSYMADWPHCRVLQIDHQMQVIPHVTFSFFPRNSYLGYNIGVLLVGTSE